MPELTAYLVCFDHAWNHAWESLEVALRDVSEDEAYWQAPAYGKVEKEDGWPPPGTIAWQVAHVTHCKRHYTDLLQHVGDGERPPARPWEPQPSLAALREVLRQAHGEQRAAIEGLGEEQLGEPVANDQPLREFLAMCIRHDTWHASQIAVVRRLVRSR